MGAVVMTRLEEEGFDALGLCGSAESLARVEERGHRGLLVDVPERLGALLPAVGKERGPAYVDMAHSRVESLVASLSPSAVDTWCAEDVGLRARWLRAVVRVMLGAGEGRCLFVSSVACARPAPGQGYYAAAKAAGEALFQAVGVEMAGRGVTTCSLRLGLVDAGRGHDFIRKRGGEWAAFAPTGRLVRVDEVADTIVFLLSPAGRNINATTVVLDGGFSAVKPGGR